MSKDKIFENKLKFLFCVFHQINSIAGIQGLPTAITRDENITMSPPVPPPQNIPISQYGHMMIPMFFVPVCASCAQKHAGKCTFCGQQVTGGQGVSSNSHGDVQLASVSSESHQGHEQMRSRSQQGQGRVRSKSQRGQGKMRSRSQRDQGKMRSRSQRGQGKMRSRSQRGQGQMRFRSHQNQEQTRYDLLISHDHMLESRQSFTVSCCVNSSKKANTLQSFVRPHFILFGWNFKLVAHG